MSSTVRVLLAGYTPFGGEKINPSGEALKLLNGKIIVRIVARTCPLLGTTPARSESRPLLRSSQTPSRWSARWHPGHRLERGRHLPLHHMMYHTMHNIATSGSSLRGTFIHILPAGAGRRLAESGEHEA
jgi:pyrrolidone-carboxylate peptidase